MGFGGFGATLELDSKELSVAVPIKYRKVDGRDLRKAMKITMKSVDTGKLVKKNSAIGGEKKSYDWRYFDTDGKEVAKDRVKYFAEVDGKQMEVKPFGRTANIEIKAEIDSSRENEFLTESTYEIWTDGKGIGKLKKLADYLVTNKRIGVANFSFGNGFRQSCALIKPVMNGDKFILTMSLCQQRKDFKNWMATAEEASEEIPTIDKLLLPLIEE